MSKLFLNTDLGTVNKKFFVPVGNFWPIKGGGRLDKAANFSKFGTRISYWTKKQNEKNTFKACRKQDSKNTLGGFTHEYSML